MKEYKQFAKDFAKKAGEIMLEHFGLGMTKEWKSENNTPVTDADLLINSLLIKEIKNRWPEHSVKGEEESNINEQSEYTWVCDPIDGTIPFSHGVPICMFSLALTKNGKSILGVTYDPFGDRLFFASQNEGAYLNNEKISVSKISNFEGVVAEYEMFKTARFDINKLAEHLCIEKDVKLVKMASIIYPSCLVAAGEFGFTIFPHNTAHDAAAVKIIVEEAGGKVTDLFGNEQRYDQDIQGVIVSNGVLHDELVSLSKQMVKQPIDTIQRKNNCAYIDGANLHKGITGLGWNLDYKRFRVWLSEKYGAHTAYLFIGLIPKYKVLYKYLQECGFTLIFKEVVYDGDGKPKGNCDADLVLQATCDAYENNFDNALLVASDGDYAGLVEFLHKKHKFLVVLSPHLKDKCSILLKRTGVKIAYINEQRSILDRVQKEKAPSGDGTPQGSFS